MIIFIRLKEREDYDMEILQFVQENLIWVIGIICILGLCFLIVYKTENFARLLGKAIGMVLQQICSLVIEAICLLFKIINSLEVYIVLLIDALTGKTSANGKIASLAIGVLSISSFYTTYTGMHSFVEQKPVAVLITLGIQAILFTTSLRINEMLNIDSDRQGKSWNGKIVACSGGVCLLGCVTAYIFDIIEVSYSTKKYLYHILYIIVIISIVFIIFLFIKRLTNISFKSVHTGVILFVIYFAVLSVSSFFSYNAFVPIMYPSSVRNIDAFQSYRVGIIALLERVDEKVDDEYYEKIKEMLEQELQSLKSIEAKEFLTSEENEIYEERAKYEEYLQKQSDLEKKQSELSALEEDWKEEYKSIVDNSGGIGRYTYSALESARNAYESKRKKLEGEIEDISTELNNVDWEVKEKAKKYEKIRNELENLQCTEEIEMVSLLIKKEEWTEEDEDNFKEAILTLENIYQKQSGDKKTNNLWNMAETYRSYVQYKETYSENLRKVLSVVVEQENYNVAYEQIRQYTYDTLKNIPETQYVFYANDTELVQTDSIPYSDYYSTMEQLNRNVNSNLSQIEINIRTFVDNKLVGIVCALMALLIDMMILFVGIILPKDMQLRNYSCGKYSEQEIKKILSNLFNKPIRR